jgi:hypothetical protein
MSYDNEDDLILKSQTLDGTRTSQNQLIFKLLGAGEHNQGYASHLF